MSVLGDVVEELARAEAKFPPMRSPHEGMAIVEEEFEEFKHEVFHGTPEGQRLEAVQLAAMSLRFIADICDRTPAVPAARML